MPLQCKCSPRFIDRRGTIQTYVESRSPEMVPLEPAAGQSVKHRLSPSCIWTISRRPSGVCVQSACRMDLFAQARSQGIQTEFVDGQGHRRVTDAAALQIILDALPPQPPGPFIGGPVVVRSGRPARSDLPATTKLPVQWKIVAGLELKGLGVIADAAPPDRVMPWPMDLPSGVHRLQLTDALATTEDVPLIAAPERAFGGDFDRCWLLAVRLYSVCSARSWGIGHFTDLAGLIELAHHLGADGVGLNPLHALFDDRPGDCSPYSPNSRLFLNALYVSVETIPEFRIDAETSHALARVREGEMIDYVAVAGLKWRALR